MSLNEILLNLFRSHGVDAAIEGEDVVFPGRDLRAVALTFRETPQSFGMSLQLDIRLDIAPGRTIVESFVGMGTDRDKAIANAFDEFAVNSFHVLLGAFFKADDERVAHQEWTIAGRTCRVTLGNVGVRGKPPAEGSAVVAWCPHLEKALRAKSFAPGVHWVRVYHATMDNKPHTLEVLLDNMAWDELRTEMTAAPFPLSQNFFSVRLFLVMHVGPGGEMTPETAVQWLADTLTARDKFTEDEAYDALAAAGMPNNVADLAYKFTQAAWGRALLEGLGVEFAPDYACFNAAGETIQAGILGDNPYYATAARLAVRYRATPGFRQVAMMSADVNVVNNALNKGSKAEDLKTGRLFFFLEAPTEAGMKKAQQTIADYVATLKTTRGK